jgi:hypothetical protein
MLWAENPTAHRTDGEMRYAATLARMAALALRRPGLVPALLGAAWRFRRRDWYRSPPFLPLPPSDYIAWRLHTAYGDEDALPEARELDRYLRWSRRMRTDGSR